VKIAVHGIDSGFVGLIRRGGSDANGQAAVAKPAVGAANPCRHCLQLIGEGDGQVDTLSGGAGDDTLRGDWVDNFDGGDGLFDQAIIGDSP